MSTLKHGRDKFHDRAVPCVFVGYPHGRKGYKVLSILDHRIYVSRDVVFHEYTFPLSSSPANPSLFSSPPPAIFHDATSGSFDHTNTAPGPSGSFDPTNTAPAPFSISNISRPQRVHKIPSHLKDYVLCSPTSFCPTNCSLTTTNLCLSPLSLSFVYLSSSSHHLLSNLDIAEPTSYEEASTHPGWQEEMQKEF